MLLGARSVRTLRGVCSEVLRQDADLWQHLRGKDNGGEYSSSSDSDGAGVMSSSGDEDMEMSQDYLDIVRGHLV